MAVGNPARTVITIAMDVLVALSIALVFRVIVQFFGQLGNSDWGQVVLAFTKPITIPFGIDYVKTGYGGVLDMDAVLSIIVYMLAEWALSIVRPRR